MEGGAVFGAVALTRGDGRGDGLGGGLVVAVALLIAAALDTAVVGAGVDEAVSGPAADGRAAVDVPPLGDAALLLLAGLGSTALTIRPKTTMAPTQAPAMAKTFWPVRSRWKRLRPGGRGLVPRGTVTCLVSWSAGAQSVHSCQPAGGGGHDGSGRHPGGGVHPGGGTGQLGGGL